VTTSPVPKEFVWGLLAIATLVAIAPRAVMRMTIGMTYFDTRDEDAEWVPRGARFVAIGCMILLAFALYFYPTK